MPPPPPPKEVLGTLSLTLESSGETCLEMGVSLFQGLKVSWDTFPCKMTLTGSGQGAHLKDLPSP